MTLTQRLIEILEDKSESITRSRAANSGKTGYASGEIAGFWFLHAVNSGLSPLRHMFYSTHGHPEELYLEMARLAGALCTFTLEHHPRSIPAYDHLQPDKCFDALDKLIRKLLETVLPTNCISIPLVYDRRLPALRHGYRPALSRPLQLGVRDSLQHRRRGTDEGNA